MLEQFNLDRLREPRLRGGGRRKISSVHRELEIMRSLLGYGATKGFLEVSPFKGDAHDAPLINKAHEKKRDIVPEEHASGANQSVGLLAYN